MGLADMPRNDNFRTIIDNVLAELTPSRGASALLLRHPSVPAYFPLSVTLGNALRGYSADILRHYYLYATAVSEESPLTLDTMSPVENLVLHGKLAVQLFEHGPVAVRNYACCSSREVLFCSLLPTGCEDIIEPSGHMKKVLAAAVAEWQASAVTVVQLGKADPRSIVTNLTRLLTDTDVAPPYFSVLYASVNAKRGPKGTDSFEGTWKANALSHNCFLLANAAQLAQDYICDMFTRGDTETAYRDELPKASAGLPAAVAAVCVDIVHCIGLHKAQSAMAFVRLNVPRENLEGNTVPNEVVDRQPKHAESSWELVKNAIAYLLLEHSESALVTVWAGRVADSQCVTAVPVGFISGGQHAALKAVAAQREIDGLRREVNSDENLVTATALLLSVEDSLCESSIQDPVAGAAKAIRGRATTIPGPYVLDFGNAEYLTISNGDTEIKLSEDKDAYRLLYALSCAHSLGQGVSKESVESLLKVENGKASTRINTIKRRLQKMGLDTSYLIASAYGSGWRWNPDSKYKKLTSVDGHRVYGVRYTEGMSPSETMSDDVER